MRNGALVIDERAVNTKMPEKCENCPYMFEYQCRTEKCQYDKTKDKNQNQKTRIAYGQERQTL